MLELEPGPSRSDARVAVLVDRDHRAMARWRTLAIRGWKRPIAIIIDEPGGRRILGLDGAPMMTEALERAFPGAAALLSQHI